MSKHIVISDELIFKNGSWHFKVLKIEVCETCQTPTNLVGPDSVSYCAECDLIVEGQTEVKNENFG